MTVKLLPCPFCTEKDAKEASPMVLNRKKKHFDKPHYTVQCTNCGCEPDFCSEDQDKAISLWNRRRKLIRTEEDIAHFEDIKNKIIDTLSCLEII